MSQTSYGFRVSGYLPDRAQHAVDDFGELEVAVTPPEAAGLEPGEWTPAGDAALLRVAALGREGAD
ncbi:hypothetical protein [Amycolatopsis sp. FDAARGOS 1241]|uniref:hypothetical protein n=1 Tax=Amycolatopsis sp. FDAARGOS 1241 TaxID=2778070 RepID=UPI001EF2DD62|nr:hypothetical protein [Amycolatopsis sp. FDAARGOS 1241]